ncbi:MAG: hypothetical protein NC114_10860 [Ruminococcus flavefaciens]|nr:hypothetical protein [Ruminococcus flavefaciens]
MELKTWLSPSWSITVKEADCPHCSACFSPLVFLTKPPSEELAICSNMECPKYNRFSFDRMLYNDILIEHNEDEDLHVSKIVRDGMRMDNLIIPLTEKAREFVCRLTGYGIRCTLCPYCLSKLFTSPVLFCVNPKCKGYLFFPEEGYIEFHANGKTMRVERGSDGTWPKVDIDFPHIHVKDLIGQIVSYRVSGK